MQLVFDRFTSTGYMTNCVGRLMVREIDALLSPHGLSAGCMPVFFALAGEDAMTQRDLAISAQVEQPTMAATLARLERDGLIERSANPTDRRSAMVSLSERGRSKLPVVHAAAAAVNAKATAKLSDAERLQLLTLLTKVAEALSSPA